MARTLHRNAVLFIGARMARTLLRTAPMRTPCPALPPLFLLPMALALGCTDAHPTTPGGPAHAAVPSVEDAGPPDGGAHPADAGSADAGSADAGGPIVLDTGVWQLNGASAALPDGDLQALDGMLQGRQVVALGETVHGVNTYAQMRARVIRYLVEHHGFRMVTFEGNWTASDVTRRYVKDNQGTLADAMSGTTFLAWYNQPTADLLQWLHDFNLGHPDDQVDIFGVDVQEPAEVNQFLRDTLGHRTEAAGALDLLRHCICGPFATGAACSQDAVHGPYFKLDALIPESDVVLCNDGIIQLDAFLESPASGVAASLGETTLVHARVALRSLRAAEKYWVDLGRATLTGQPGAWESGFTSRDHGWADVMLMLRAHHAPQARTVLWAHNTHVMRRSPLATGSSLGTQGRTRTVGTWLEDALGAAYAPVALVALHEQHNFSGTMVVDSPVRSGANDMERVLSEVGPDHLFVDTAEAAHLWSGRRWNMGGPLGDQGHPADLFVGLLYMRHTEASVFFRP